MFRVQRKAEFSKTILLLGIVVCLFQSDISSEYEWEVARADYAWDFPRDHWARDGYKTEWWYFTGHLEADSGERFGYQFTFFRVGLLKERPDVVSDWGAKDLIMGHAALSPLPARGGAGEPAYAKATARQAGSWGERAEPKHRFSELLYRAVPLLGGFGDYPDERIAWSRGPAGTAGTWELKWNGEAFDFSAVDDELGFAFDLETRPAKPMIFQGPNGFSQKSETSSAASQYYSFTRLTTSGSVTLDGQTYTVSGQSWMDKEFFTNTMTAEQVGWDWFSLQLDDGRELMLYILRDAEGRLNYARGTLVLADRQTEYLSQTQFTIESGDTWASPSGDRYPVSWSVQVSEKGLRLNVEAQAEDQENRSRLIPTLRYWEGAVNVLGPDGERIGVGFVEMTGYGSSTTPAL